VYSLFKRTSLSRLTFLSIALLAYGFADVPQSANSAESKSSQEKPQATNDNKIDLNTASRKDLQSLPGIGAASAKKIIASRPYSNLSDLAKAGISQKTAQKLAPFVILSGVPAEIASPAANEEKAAAAEPAITADSSKSGASKRTANAKSKTARLPPQKGMVWVNLDSGVYHKEGTRWYGKTKSGKFMNEADAIKGGYRSAKN